MKDSAQLPRITVVTPSYNQARFLESAIVSIISQDYLNLEYIVLDGGRFKNNIGGPVSDKLAFIKDYKFTIAFEGASYLGYTTEKLMQPMLVHSLAIYWGNELVHREFNPESFLNSYDFADDEELIERIIEIDQNDDLYLEYLQQPYFHNNAVNEYVNPENVLKQFDYIFNNDKEPVAFKMKKSFFFLFIV